MNKTISINLGGRNFFIEEDAYAKLNAYLTGIKTHFAKYQGSEEIVADMEGRIAEKFEAKHQNDPKAVITSSDIDGLIAELGTVEDIAGEEGAKSGQKSSGQQFTQKRLMRNGGDKIVAGVCSGLGAYFNVDPIVFRLIFGLLVFAWGAIIPIYFLLWIIMPEAKTPTEKMEMRGEPLNLDSLSETIKERAQEFKVHVENVTDKQEWKKWGEDIKDKAHKLKEDVKGWNERSEVDRKDSANAGVAQPSQSVAETVRPAMPRNRSGFGNFIRQIFVGIGRIIKFIFHAIFFIVGLAIVIGLSFGMAGLTVGIAIALFNSSSSYIGFPLATIAHGAPYYVLLVAGYFIALMPLLFFMLIGSSLLNRRNYVRTAPAFSFLGIWIFALAIGGIVGMRYVPGYVDQIKNSPELQTVSKTFYDVNNFQNLDLSNSGNYTLVQGSEYSVKAQGWSMDLDRLDVSVNNGTLAISEHSRNFCVFCFSGNPKIEITAPEFDSITGHNSVSIFSDKLVATSSALTLTNSSHAKILYRTKALTIDLRNSSSANVSSSGTVDSLKATLMNSSDLTAPNLLAKDANLTTGNSSRATVNVTGTLNYDSFNSSQIYYFGNPHLQGNSAPFDNMPIPANPTDYNTQSDFESY